MASAAASTVLPTVGSTVWNLLERLLNICIMPTQRKLQVIVILLTCIVNTVGEYIPTPAAAQHSHIANVHHNPDFRETKKKNARMIVDSIRDSNCERLYFGKPPKKPSDNSGMEKYAANLIVTEFCQRPQSRH